MNKEKILTWGLIFVIAVGFTLATVDTISAAKRTVKFKADDFKNYKLGKGDYIGALYSLKGGQYSPKTVVLQTWSSNYYPRYYKMTKAKIYFKKNNGKIVSKTYKGQHISKKVPKGLTPKKAVVYYKKK